MLATRWNVIAIPTIEITGGDKPVGEALLFKKRYC
jgi:hypothetical protein